MSEEDRKWLEQLIRENKESDSELTYTYCPFSVLYALQQENQKLKEQLEKKYKEVGTLTNEILYEENTKLLSVLDEIREYINNHSIYFATKEKVGNYFANCSCDKLLQILDKVKE